MILQFNFRHKIWKSNYSFLLRYRPVQNTVSCCVFCNVAKVIFSQCSHFITGPDHQPITLRKRIIVRNYTSFTTIAVHWTFSLSYAVKLSGRNIESGTVTQNHDFAHNGSRVALLKICHAMNFAEQWTLDRISSKVTTQCFIWTSRNIKWRRFIFWEGEY